MKRPIIFSIFLFLFLAVNDILAQVVSAGLSDTICNGQYVKLDGYIEGDEYLYYYWTGDNTITDSSKVVTWAQPQVTTTYYLLAFRPDTALVKNGDFEQGNVGFTSAYTYNPTTTVMPEGHYNLVTNGTLAKSDWMNIGDHTTGNGLFMAINAAVVPNVTIWAQSVPVQPNTRYVFYAWVSTMIAREVSEAPLLQFSINNILLDQPFRGPFPITNGWEQFYTIWDSGNNTTANIKIVNQSTVSWGNDLGLDDIFFAIIKPDIDSVTIVVGDPSYSYDTVSVCHNTSHVFIDTIIVEPGDYVRQLYTVNGCDSFIHLRVNFYPEMAVDLGEDQIICKQDSTSTTLQVPDIYYKYLWSTGDTTHSIRVSESGTYYITVYNEIDCFASDEVQITFVEKPDVVIENLTENFCLEYKSQLKVETPLPDILWSTGDITNEIEVTKFGTYYVTVSEHHCSAMDSAIISFCCPVNPGIPNVITPSNNDGVNDIFKYLEDFPFEAYRLIIYDRWGKVVYKTSNPEAFWDGTVNGSILKGLYYYVIELEDGCAFHGSLTVL